MYFYTFDSLVLNKKFSYMPGVGTDVKSTTVGYQINKGDFSESSPNLPQRIAILGEANTANQVGINLVGQVMSTAQAAGVEYGFGSPIHSMMRILKPVSGGGVGGIPVVVYPQAEPGAAAAKEIEVTPTGVATGNGTHTVVVAGRNSIDGDSYNVGILSGDNEDAIVQKISDVVNAVLGSPVTGVPTLGVGAKTTYTTKWKGLTAEDVFISIDTNGNDLGITYAVADTAAGAGTPAVTSSLTSFAGEWNTIVINGYGLVSATMAELEAFNGVADNDSSTGRYVGTVMKPFRALSGTVESDVAALVAITDPRKTQMTVAACPAPNSPGLPYESAANWGAIWSRQAQDNPHLDIQNKVLPDMPVPLSIGDMEDFEQRDIAVKGGCSTVELSAGQYKVKDFVCTYHPDGEVPAQYDYNRIFVQDMNIFYGYFLLEAVNVMDKSIATDTDTVNVGNVVKPKQWKGILFNYAEDLSRRSLIVLPGFMQNGTTVAINATNPNRFETRFPYKRSGFSRISASEATAGFNFGS